MMLYPSLRRKFIPRCKLAPIAEHIDMYEMTSPVLMLLLGIGPDFNLELCKSGRIIDRDATWSSEKSLSGNGGRERRC
jgi:hypothetical protein